MPYVDDLIANPAAYREVFQTETASMDFVTAEIAGKMFPEVEVQASTFLAYFPFKLCHSYPTVNERGRGFTPRVLFNSFASLKDQLIDWEHKIQANGLSFSDRIIGHVKATRFELPANWQDAETAAVQKPLPVHGLGCLFRRAQGVEQAITNHVAKKEKWACSMECGHRWKDACFVYDGEFIPLPDAELAMRECVEVDKIRPFKGKKLAALLGGLAGKVEFWGMAFTQDPAEQTAEILNFIGANPVECASRKIFSMPLQRFSNLELEVANSTVDKMIEEVASLEIIGETQPAEDGHKHLVLSNLTILPANGHSHSLGSYGGSSAILSRGSNPRLTGVTDLHSVYPSTSEGGGQSYQHMHLVNIPLKGKFKQDGDSSDDSQSLGLSVEEVAAMEKTLQDILTGLQESTANLVKATTDADRTRYQAEIASRQKEIAELNSKTVTEETKKAYVVEQIKEGKLLTKEVADQMITTAVDGVKKELTEDFQKQQKAESVRNERIQKCIAAGMDLDAVFEVDGKAVQRDGKDITVRDRVSQIPIDDEAAWNIEFVTLSHLFPPAKINEETPELVGAGAGEAANKKPVSSGNGSGATTPRRIGALAGSGPGRSATETASNPKDQKFLRGRNAITKR